MWRKGKKMRTINDIYNELYTVDDYESGTQGFEEHMKHNCDFSNKILEEVFKPLVKQAGMEWGKLVFNVWTKEVGVFKTGCYHLLNDYIIFCPFDKNWIPKNTYKKVTTSTNNDTILTILKRDYVPYTGEVPEFNTSLVDNGAYVEKGYYNPESNWFGTKGFAELHVSNICRRAQREGREFSRGLVANNFFQSVKVCHQFSKKSAAQKYLKSIKENYGDILLGSAIEKSNCVGKYDVIVVYKEKAFVKAYVCA